MKGIFNMKKIFFAVIITIMLFCILPMKVSAETVSTKSAMEISKESRIKVSVQTTGSTSQNLKWTADSDALYYEIYSSNEYSPAFSRIARVKNNALSVGSLDEDTKYSYKVRPIYKGGTNGVFSKSVSAYTYNKFGNNYKDTLYDKTLSSNNELSCVKQ